MKLIIIFCMMIAQYVVQQIQHKEIEYTLSFASIWYLLLNFSVENIPQDLFGYLSYFQELKVWVWQMRIFREQVIPLCPALWRAAITPWWHLLGKQSTFTVVSTIWATDRFSNCQYLIADNRGKKSLCLWWNLSPNCQNTSI